jgi:hypothetical protein
LQTWGTVFCHYNEALPRATRMVVTFMVIWRSEGESAFLRGVGEGRCGAYSEM